MAIKLLPQKKTLECHYFKKKDANKLHFGKSMMTLTDYEQTLKNNLFNPQNNFDV